MKTTFPVLFILAILTSCNLLGTGGDGDRPNIPGKIVFSADDNSGTSQIYTINADGSGLRQLTDFPASGEAIHPSWSPDGEQILFSSFQQGTSIGPALWVMDADGSNQRVLYDAEPDNPHAPPLAGRNARWSPDGSKIVYDLCINCQLGTNYELFTYEVATEGVSRLTDNRTSETHPAWSPDDRRIVFVSDRDYMEADTLRFRKDLYLIDADGSNLKRLTESGFPGGYTWMTTNEIIQTVTDRNTNLKEVLLLNVKTGSTTTLMEDLEFKNQLWVFWDSVNQQLFTMNKNHKQLPVIIATSDLDGTLLQQFQLDSKKMKSALGFDFYPPKRK